MIKSINTDFNKPVNFKGNINTRMLLELAEDELISCANSGKPRLERLQKDKFERLLKYKKDHGDSIYEIYRSCTRKIKRYANETLAQKAAKAAEKHQGIKFSTYHCPICLKWHLCKATNKFLKSWD